MSRSHGHNDVVLFSSSSAAGGSIDQSLGRVVASEPAKPCQTLTVDASLVEPEDKISLSRVIRSCETLGTPRDLLDEEPVDFIEVYKRGAATGLRSGLLDPSPSAQVLVDQTQGECSYLEGFYVEGLDGAFATGGDSGSIVIDDDDRVLGMVVGVTTTTDRAFLVPIVPILDSLGVDLIGPG